MQKIDYLKAMNIQLWVPRVEASKVDISIHSQDVHVLLQAILFAIGDEAYLEGDQIVYRGAHLFSLDTLNHCLTSPAAKKLLWQDIRSSLTDR